MALKSCEMFPNSIKIAIFPKSLQKIAQWLGAVASRIRLSYASLFITSSKSDSFGKLLLLVHPWLHRARLSILHYTVSLSHEKSLFWETSDDVIAFDLRFPPP